MTGGRAGAAWKWILSIAVSATLLYFSLRGVDWPQVWRNIASADWRYIAAAGGITCTSFLLRAFRWRILLNAEARFPIATVFWANMVGYLGNNFLPARAGEVVRCLLISGRSKLSRTYVLTTAVSERLTDVIALVLASSIVLLGVKPKPQWMGKMSATMAVIAGAGAIAIAVLPHTGNLLSTILRRIPMPERIRTRILGLTEQILLGVRAFHDWGRLAGFVALTAVVWTLDACTMMLVAKGMGVAMPFTVAMLLLAGLGLGSALPSTPGYVGVYQFVAVSVLGPFGVGRDAALAFILVAQALGYVVIVILGLPGLYVMQGGGMLRSASAQALSEE
jgi:uncharacterized protein (TIRG00374 family)